MAAERDIDGVYDREIVRGHDARDVGAAGGVHRDRRPIIVTRSAQVSGIDQRGTRGIQFA